MNKCWTAANVMAALINYTLTYIFSTPSMGYLILDDVIIPKRYAKKLAYVYWEHDYVDNKKIRCMRVVLLLWTNGYIKLPVGYAILHKKGSAFLTEQGLPYRTKNDLAMELIKKALYSRILFEYLTFDSWYASRDNLKLLHNQLHVSFVTALKCTTNIRFVRDAEPEQKRKRGRPKRYEKLQCHQLAQQFPDLRCHPYKQIDARARGFLISLRSVSDELKIVLVRDYAKSQYLKDIAEEPKKKRHPHKYIFTNMTNLTVVEIVQRYRARWAIETFFRDLKQHVGLGRTNGRTVEHAHRHVALVLLAYVCLELLKDIFALHPIHREKMTIGDIKLALCTHFVQCSKTEVGVQVKPLSPMTIETFLQIRHQLEEDCPDNLSLEEITVWIC